LQLGDLGGETLGLLGRRLYASSGGRLRRRQNWIGRPGSTPVNADFVPPRDKQVRPLLKDLCAFIEREDVPILAQAAIAHAQFETIHPFGDGNGRVGRCLIHVVLRRRELAPRYVPPISLILAARVKQLCRRADSLSRGTDQRMDPFFCHRRRHAAAVSPSSASLSLAILSGIHAR
jgi:Fic family protein